MRKPLVQRDDLLASLFQWLDTDEGMISMKTVDHVAAALEGVDLDVEERRILWPDGKSLTVHQTARRIQNKIPMDLQAVESHLLCWMEMRFEPMGLDERHMEAFRIQLNLWIADHKRENLES